MALVKRLILILMTAFVYVVMETNSTPVERSDYRHDMRKIFHPKSTNSSSPLGKTKTTTLSTSGENVNSGPEMTGTPDLEGVEPVTISNPRTLQSESNIPPKYIPEAESQTGALHEEGNDQSVISERNLEKPATTDSTLTVEDTIETDTTNDENRDTTSMRGDIIDNHPDATDNCESENEPRVTEDQTSQGTVPDVKSTNQIGTNGSDEQNSMESESNLDQIDTDARNDQRKARILTHETNHPHLYRRQAPGGSDLDQSGTNQTLTCSEPAMKDLHENYTQINDHHDIKIMARNINSTTPSPQDLFDHHCQEGYAPYRSSTCSRALLGLNRGEINEMSTCPWTYVHNFNSQRYPTTMMFAQCECTQCIENGDFSVTNYCRPIYAKVRVLRRQKCHMDMGQFWYSPDFERVPVACVCTRPNEL